MKLLFDQNLSPRLAFKLAGLSPDSNLVYALDLDRAQDQEVYEYARREGFMLVTKDADFDTSRPMIRGCFRALTIGSKAWFQSVWRVL